ncbi:MAG: MerR family transcriptional regulator [Anaerolineae bacterium]|jgi:DNA-binding transcriptional MerR regulator|nr:MerR family transcriptional regulator [Anaerolineae bacterium]
MSAEVENSQAETAIYNIGAVTRMTDIPVATLRAWERRYDFPVPARTSGKHRLYSESEVQQLLWIKARLAEGMQIRHAIEALRRHEALSPTIEHIPLLAPPPVVASDIPSTSLQALAERLQLALFHHRIDEADSIVNAALALHPLEDLTLHVVTPVLFAAGEAWASGRITVATEHLATEYLRHRLAMWLEAGPPPYATPPIVLACPPEEWHDTSLLILGVLLRRRRWPVIHLGQSLPLADLASFVQKTAPLAVIFVAMREESAVNLAGWTQWLPEALRTGRPLVAFGGNIFVEQPEWRARVPGLYLGDSLQAGLEAVDRLLRERTGR